MTEAEALQAIYDAIRKYDGVNQELKDPVDEWAAIRDAIANYKRVILGGRINNRANRI